MAAATSLLARQMAGLTLGASQGIVRQRLCVPLSSLSGCSNVQSRLFVTVLQATPVQTPAPGDRAGDSHIPSRRNISLSTAASPITDENSSMTHFSSLPSKQYAWMDMTTPPRKLKPYILKRRRNKLRTYVGKHRNIRHSPWRLNLVCQLAAGLTLEEAMVQLEFCHKKAAPMVQNVLRKTANLADIRDNLKPSQLEVAECFATHGSHLKRLKIMGRGNAGKMLHRHSHIRLILREIDFPLRIYQARTVRQKQKWIQKMELATQEYNKAKAERDELEQLERQQQAKQKQLAK